MYAAHIQVELVTSNPHSNVDGLYTVDVATVEWLPIHTARPQSQSLKIIKCLVVSNPVSVVIWMVLVIHQSSQFARDSFGGKPIRGTGDITELTITQAKCPDITLAYLNLWHPNLHFGSAFGQYRLNSTQRSVGA